MKDKETKSVHFKVIQKLNWLFLMGKQQHASKDVGNRARRADWRTLESKPIVQAILI